MGTNISIWFDCDQPQSDTDEEEDVPNKDSQNQLNQSIQVDEIVQKNQDFQFKDNKNNMEQSMDNDKNQVSEQQQNISEEQVITDDNFNIPLQALILDSQEPINDNHKTPYIPITKVQNQVGQASRQINQEASTFKIAATLKYSQISQELTYVDKFKKQFNNDTSIPFEDSSLKSEIPKADMIIQDLKKQESNLSDQLKEISGKSIKKQQSTTMTYESDLIQLEENLSQEQINLPQQITSKKITKNLEVDDDISLFPQKIFPNYTPTFATDTFNSNKHFIFTQAKDNQPNEQIHNQFQQMKNKNN